MHPLLRQAGTALLLLGLTAACGTDPDTAEGTGATAADATAPAEETAQAVVVENCGRQLTFDAPPQRVVSTSQQGTEMLLALGLGDQVVGTAFTYAEPLPEQAEAFAAVPDLGDGATREVVLQAEPDLVLAGFFDGDLDAEAGNATEEELAEAGAQVFGLTGSCAEDPAETTIETTYEDLLALGDVFGVTDRATEVVDEMRATVSAVEQRLADATPVRAVAYANGEGPLGLVGAGIADDVLRRAGVENLFADTGETFSQVSVEEVAAAAPEAFLTVDYSPGPTPQEKAEQLYRLLPEAPATRDERAMPVPDIGLNEGIRNAATVEAVARALHPDAF